MIDLSVTARKNDNNDDNSTSTSVTLEKTGSHGDEYVVMASAQPASGSARTPTEVVCVVDISGSMDSVADCQDENGNVESSGLSLLDVTKHALRTVIAALHPGDKFGLVSYSDAGRRELPLTDMNDEGKEAATKTVEALQTEGCTNLFDGLVVGLDTFVESGSKANRSVLILTDGQPNREPPKGHIPGLRNYLDEHPGLNVSINTFGFGYNLKSDLLKEIAQEGSGTYTFVPDAGFVGTGFVNSLGNVCSTCAVNTILSFQAEDGCSVKPLCDASGFTSTSWGASVNVGTVQFEQSKDVLALVTVPSGAQLSDFLDVHIKYESVGTGKANEASANITAEALDASNLPEILYQTARLNLVDTIDAAMELKKTGSDPDAACAVVKQFIGQWEDKLKNDCFTLTAGSKDVAAKIRDVIKDASGQVSEALSRDDWYQKWGQHYLPSLSQSHLTQRCNNFKDPGIQHYGGSVFGEVRDFADDQFNKLPPPKPSRQTGGNYRAVNMAAYNNVRGGCVSGDAQVLMADGSARSANKISKGDSVACAGGKSSIVKCVVKTNSDASGMMPLVKLGGMFITPWHPVRKNSNGRWYFPADLGCITNQECRAVYTFVLESEHEMLINGYHYASLGHGKKDEVVRHSFWGNMTAVTDSLSACKGWHSGSVEFSIDNLLRTKDGIVTGFNIKSERFNEKKTENSLLRDQIEFYRLAMMEDDKQAPSRQLADSKSVKATAKLQRNSQRPRCPTPGGKSSKSMLRDLEEQILLGKELFASA